MNLGLSVSLGTDRRLADPRAVFGSALKVWFDNQDLTTMWQDTSATVPAAVGSRVAKQFCKANPAFYRQQSTLAQQPFLRQAANGSYYLECSTSSLITPSIDFSSSDKMAVYTGLRKLSDAALGCAMELSVSISSNNGTFFVFAPPAANPSLAFSSKGTAQGTASINNVAWTSPVTVVLTGIGNISGDSAVLRVNGAQVNQSATDQGTGNYGSYPLYYFRRGGSSLPFNGWEYGSMIVLGITPTAAQTAFAEGYFNALTGAY